MVCLNFSKTMLTSYLTYYKADESKIFSKSRQFRRFWNFFMVLEHRYFFMMLELEYILWKTKWFLDICKMSFKAFIGLIDALTLLIDALTILRVSFNMISSFQSSPKNPKFKISQLLSSPLKYHNADYKSLNISCKYKPNQIRYIPSQRKKNTKSYNI